MNPTTRWQDEWQSVNVARLGVGEAGHRLDVVRERLHEGVSYEGQEADAEHASELEAKILAEADGWELRAELHASRERAAGADDPSVKAAEGHWASLLSIRFLQQADTAQLAAEAAAPAGAQSDPHWRESVERALSDHRLVDQIADLALEELRRWDPLSGSNADGEHLRKLARAAEKLRGADGLEQFLERLGAVDHRFHSDQLEHFSAAIGREAATEMAEKMKGRDVDVGPTAPIEAFSDSFVADLESGQVAEDLATFGAVAANAVVAKVERLADAVEYGVTHPIDAAEEAIETIRDLPGDVADAVRELPDMPDRLAAAWKRFEQADRSGQVKMLAEATVDAEVGVLIDRGVGSVAGKVGDAVTPNGPDLPMGANDVNAPDGPAPADVESPAAAPGPGAVAAPAVGAALRQRFMSDALDRILAADDHPLEFLVQRNPDDPSKGSWRGRSHLDDVPAVQAGHLESRHSGAPERLAVEDAEYNQKASWRGERQGATFQKTAIEIDGVVVDRETARMWERLGLLPEGTVDSAPAHNGWTPDAGAQTEPPAPQAGVSPQPSVQVSPEASAAPDPVEDYDITGHLDMAEESARAQREMAELSGVTTREQAHREPEAPPPPPPTHHVDPAVGQNGSGSPSTVTPGRDDDTAGDAAPADPATDSTPASGDSTGESSAPDPGQSAPTGGEGGTDPAPQTSSPDPQPQGGDGDSPPAAEDEAECYPVAGEGEGASDSDDADSEAYPMPESEPVVETEVPVQEPAEEAPVEEVEGG